MGNNFLKLEHIHVAHKKSSYTLRMIMSVTRLHSFSTYMQLILSSSLCARKDWLCLVRIMVSWITRNRFNCFLYKLQILIKKKKRKKKKKKIFAKIASVDLCFL